MSGQIQTRTQAQTQTQTPTASDGSLDDVRRAVRDHYAASARSVADKAAACCGDAQVSILAIADYDPAAVAELPQDAVLASLGCGNPTALAQLSPGEVVLDLGSGGGIDVLLSAKRVGPTGFVYGLDMTDEMLELAERNRAEAGIDNVRFLKGHIEDIPLPDNSVDVIISNCVINLSGDKDRVLREAFRVLRPNGRFAVSDIVVQGRLLPVVRQSIAFWSACVSGALSESEYREKLAAAGFGDIDLEITSVYALADLMEDDGCCGVGAGCCGPETATTTAAAAAASAIPAGFDLKTLAEMQDKAGKIVSAFVRASKPAAV